MGYLFRNIPAVIILFIILFSFSGFTQVSTSKSNIDVINSNLDAAADSVVALLLSFSADTVYIGIKTSEAERYFNNILLSKAEKKGIVFILEDIESGKKPYLELTNSIVLAYKNDSDDADSLIRSIECLWSGTVSLKDGRIKPVNLSSGVFEDKILREEAELYNKNPYDFAKSKIPPKPSSFWKEIVQPVAIIGAAVITVVLLFSMRSN